MPSKSMKLKQISYGDLKPKQKEIFNFQKIAGMLAHYGFNCIKLADDWQGADFLAYHKNGNETLKVQLKSRLTIDKKYMGKALYIAFPYKGSWYILEHDVLLEKVKKYTTWLDSKKSWQGKGGYNSTNPNKKLIESLEAHRLLDNQSL